MLSTTLQDAINEQIKHELYSAYLYLSMSAHCESVNLRGCAHWMKSQAAEEQSHAMKLFGYVFERGGKVTLKGIDQPPAEWTSPLDLFENVLKHEQSVTGMIHRLYALALKENDYASQIMLQWFVTEQVEEEANASAIVEQLKIVGAHGQALFMLDRQLGAR